jgi:Holliday junction resolvase
MTEAKLQSAIVKYLKNKGCYVIKTSPGGGTPVGCPDIIALLEGCWIAIEVKASQKSPFRPLQEHTLERLDEWSWAKVVYPENWDRIKTELEEML